MSEDNCKQNHEENQDNNKQNKKDEPTDKMQRAMEFILDRQAKNEVEIQKLEEQSDRLKKEAEEDRKNMDKRFQEFVEQAELDRQDMREAVNRISEEVSKLTLDVDRLVDIVENSRDFTQQVARLAIATEKRVARLEKRT